MEKLKTEASPFKLVLAYLLFGSAWIFFSDRLLYYVIIETGELTVYQTYKGVVFVLLTSALLFLILQRSYKRILNLYEARLNLEISHGQEMKAVNERLESHLAERKFNELALIENEARLRVVIEESPVGIAFSRDGVTLSANSAYLGMFGYDNTSELEGTSLLDQIAPQSRAEIEDRIKRRAEGQEVETTYETVGQKKDGSQFPFLVSISRIETPEGPLTISFFMDITERKLQERVLMASVTLSKYALSHSFDEALSKVLDEAEELTGSNIGFFHFVDEDELTLLLQMWSTNTLKNMCTAEGKGSHYSVEKAGVWADAVRLRKPVIHNDYNSLPGRKGLPSGHAPVLRELVIPIFQGDRIVAVFGVGNKPVEYSPQDVSILTRLGYFILDVVLAKRAEEKLQKSNGIYRVLSKVNEALVRVNNVSELYDSICRVIVEDGGFRMSWIGLYDDNDNSIKPVSSAGYVAGYLDNLLISGDGNVVEGRGPTGIAFRKATPVVCKDIENDPMMTPWKDKALKRGYLSSAAMPLWASGRIVGTLNIYSDEKDYFKEEEVKLLNTLSEDLSFGLDYFETEKRRREAEEVLRRLNEELEERVKDRTAELMTKNSELERMNKLFVGRELKMKELKAKINELEQKAEEGSVQ